MTHDAPLQMTVAKSIVRVVSCADQPPHETLLAARQRDPPLGSAFLSIHAALQRNGEPEPELRIELVVVVDHAFAVAIEVPGHQPAGTAG